MSNRPQLDIVSCDPLISTDFSTFSPAPTPISPRSAIYSAAMEAEHSIATTRLVGEQDPLLGMAAPKKPFYRARPLWLVPFAITASLVRGMTLAPRVEVFTQLSCSALHGHLDYNHTTALLSQSFIPPSQSLHNPHTAFYFSLDPLGPHLHISPNHYANHSSLPLPIHTQTNLVPSNGEEDPRRLPSPSCLSDSAVQAGAARLQAIMTTTMGLLSALTTGWWGHFGERYGRTKVLAISTFGLFLTDLIFILVSTPSNPLSSHSHKFIYFAPVIEGLLGGWSTLQSATSAYISDCTSSGSRANIFSKFTGVFYLGASLGPGIGAFLISHPIGFWDLASSDGRQSVTCVFWVAILCSFINFLLVLFVFPESLPKEQQSKAQFEYNGKGKGKFKAIASPNGENADSEVNGSSNGDNETSRKGGGIIKGFFSPLAIFLPVVIIDGTRKRKDWSLTLLAIALFGYMLSSGVFQIKYLYAVHVYGWGAEQLSYYISFVGGARAIYLLFILPFIIATFKPKPGQSTKSKVNAKSVKIKSTTKLIAPPPQVPVKSKSAKPTKAHLAREIQFDLLVTRFSFIVDIMSHSFVALAPSPSYNVHIQTQVEAPQQSYSHSQALFVLATSLSSFGSGSLPAIQSLALCILQARGLDANEGQAAGGDGGTGSLFGALSVLQAVGQMILGPMLFGLVYSETVATFPKAIFTTAAGIVVVSLALVLLVRSPVTATKGKKRRAREEVEVERGRSRVSKDLRGGSVGRYPSYGSGGTSETAESSGSV